MTLEHLGDGRPRVKICGLTNADDARACVNLGADAIGVVFAPGGPRYVQPKRAAEVFDGIPDAVARVGVFVSPSDDDVLEALNMGGLTHIQVHGGANVARIADLTGVPVIEVVAVASADDVAKAAASEASFVLLDAAVPGRHGGTGKRFDWGLLEAHPIGRPFGLAGGLSSDVVAEAVRRVSPALLDVSSGVEVTPGRKDLGLVEAFIDAAWLAAASAS